MLPENIPVYNREVGIFCSAGTDSSLLLYFLLKKYKYTVHVFTIANSYKNNVNVKCAIDVVDACIRLTGNSNVEHHILHREKQSDKDFYFADNYQGITDVYYGITANPPIDVLQSFTNNELAQENHIRDCSVERDEVEYFSNGCTHIIPWYNIDKRKIASYYKKYDLLDTLFPLTRSCESVKDVGAEHCGNCAWCEERLWGFGRLT